MAYIPLNFWSFRSLLNARKPLYLRPDDAEIAESLVNDLARVGLVTVDDVFTMTFHCNECGSTRLAPQFRFAEGRSFRFRSSHRNYLGPFFEKCRFCERQKNTSGNEVVCQGLERSDP